MAINTYTIGLVVSAAGITGEQSKWIKKTLVWTRKALGPDPKLVLLVAGITQYASSNFGLHHSVLAKHWPRDVESRYVAGTRTGLTRTEATLLRAKKLEECDEVWCLPCHSQSGRLSKTRPAMSFWLGVSGPRANIYKWVPPWVGAADYFNQPIPKELPWKTK
jgi:hypothetical protein